MTKVTQNENNLILGVPITRCFLYVVGWNSQSMFALCVWAEWQDKDSFDHTHAPINVARGISSSLNGPIVASPCACQRISQMDHSMDWRSSQSWAAAREGRVLPMSCPKYVTRRYGDNSRYAPQSPQTFNPSRFQQVVRTEPSEL